MRNLFITFEGVEGCGKSTQSKLLKEYLEAKGCSVLALREPGGTRLGEKVRSILLNSDDEPIDPWAELFLYEACRAQLISSVIRPALETSTIICDRFTDSTVAYQGYGRCLGVEAVIALNEMATGGLRPDVTILLDCDPKEGLKRAWSRISAKEGAKEDRFEKEDIAFHERVRQGYIELARKDKRIRLVEAGREIPSIHKEICDIIEGRL